VILNQLGIYFSNSPDNGANNITVLQNISGGQSLLIGYIRDTDRRRSTQFIPGAASENPFFGNPTQTATSSAAVLNRTPNLGSSGTTGVGSAGAGNISLDYSSNSTGHWTIMPSNFYMGPGDSLSIKISAEFGGGPLTANITYSFTTITES
jgi:hypothetical protein